MNKKAARKKKQQRQKLITRQNILESEIIGENEGEEETLLGNLARVKQIPMIAWESIPAMPTFYKSIHIPLEKGGEWFEKLFTERAGNEDCDLIGFTPLRKLEEGTVENLGAGSVGMAMQILEVEKTVTNSLIIKMRGICRYKTLGFLPAPDEYFTIAVHWFEDTEEPEAVVRPLHDKYLKHIEHIARIMGDRMKGFTNVSQNVGYDYLSAQYSSFMLLNAFENWFTIEQQIEMLKLTSTSERLKRVNKRLDEILPYLEKREKIRDVGRNN